MENNNNGVNNNVININNENNNNMITTQDETTGKKKQVKVVIKEIYKHTQACMACRTRKRKCDGKAPCSYCVAKKQPCEFTQQRKRGPPRKSEERRQFDPGFLNRDFSLSTSAYESQIFDRTEAKMFLENSWGYMRHRTSNGSYDQILMPKNISHKILSYATLAFAARINGNAPRAATYISQARSFAGSIFDNPESDSVAALLMISHYYQLVLDIPLAKFYSSSTIALSRMTKLEGKLNIFCKVGDAFINCTSPKEQSERVKSELKAFQLLNSEFDCPFVDAAAEILGVFGFNILFPQESSIQNFLHVVDDLVVSEEERDHIISTLHYVKVKASFIASSVVDLLFYDFITSLYQSITNWKSGHAAEAMSYARTCVETLKQLAKENKYGVASDFPHICMLGSLCKFFYEQGDIPSVLELCQFIKDVCSIMQPEYNFVVILIDQFLTTQVLNGTPPRITEIIPSPSLSSSSPPYLSSSPSPPDSPYYSPSPSPSPSFSSSYPSSSSPYASVSPPAVSFQTFTSPAPIPTISPSPISSSPSLSFVDNSTKYSSPSPSLSRTKFVQGTTETQHIEQIPFYVVENFGTNMNLVESLLSSTDDSNFNIPLINM